MGRLVIVMVVLAGCAPVRSSARTSAPTAVFPAALQSWSASSAGGSTASFEGGAPRRAVVSPLERVSAQSSPSPRSGRRVDIDLERAPLADALQLLAEAAGRSLVTEPDLGALVSVRLRRVDPLRAMHALSAAHGVEIHEVRGVLVARPRGTLPGPSSPE